MSGNTITGYTLANPVSITIRSAERNVLEQIRAAKASHEGNTVVFAPLYGGQTSRQTLCVKPPISV